MGRLNGWHRLWIVLSALYLLIVSAVVFITWPIPEATYHRGEFLERLSPESRQVIRLISGSEFAARNNSSKTPSVEMPNRAILVFILAVPDTQMENAAREYWSVVQASSKQQRLAKITYGLLAWLLPCAGLYALGWAVGWVYRGLRPG